MLKKRWNDVDGWYKTLTLANFVWAPVCFWAGDDLNRFIGCADMCVGTFMVIFWLGGGLSLDD